MSFLDGWRYRIAALLRSGSRERELREEMQFHIDLDSQQLGDRGAARRRFGNVTQHQERTRELSRPALLDALGEDVRYAWRSMLRSPAFTLTVVGLLALGLGVNAAVFSVLDRIFLRAPAGVSDPESLRKIWFHESGIRSRDGQPSHIPVASGPMYVALRDAMGAGCDMRRDAAASCGIAGYVTDWSLAWNRPSAVGKVRGVFASANYFNVLGLRPALGRFYTPAEDSLGAGARVVVLGHRFWSTDLRGDTSAVGSLITIEKESYHVIGVLPRDFTGLDLQAADVWIPLASVPRRHWLMSNSKPWWENGNSYMISIIERANGNTDVTSLGRATLAVRESHRRTYRINPDTLMTVVRDGLMRGSLGELGQDMKISARLAIVATLVLVIACANVANLLLARSVRRRREIAVRLALGISRMRLVRLLTLETLLLALVAGGVAIAVAATAGTYLRDLLLPEVTWYESVLHWRVVLFAIAAAIASGLAAGVIPAIQASSPRLSSALKEGARDGTVHRSRLRQGLVAVQAALSVVLLVGAALFVSSLENVRSLDLGYDVDRLVFGSAEVPEEAALPDAVAEQGLLEVAQRLERRPGVESVALTSLVPMHGFSMYNFFWDADSAQSLGKDWASTAIVSPTFFSTVGLRFIRGRTFDSSAASANQIVLNEPMAARLWPGRDAIGQCIRISKRENPCHVVTGIVESSRRSYVIEDDPALIYYLPVSGATQKQKANMVIAMRARAESYSGAVAELNGALRTRFPGADVRITPMHSVLEPEYRPWRLGATLFTAIGVLALLVALVGIYSTVSYAVSQRSHEFGVRVALGARVRDVLALVIGEGVRVVAVGVLVGVAIALAAGKLVASMLYGVEANDPIVVLGVSSTLIAAAALASLLPAWRAARVDPVVALRAD